MPIKDKIDPVIIELFKRMNKHGYAAYIVGGAVRDLLLDRIPKDYDVATDASPEQIRKVFGRNRARIIGRRFRLVHVYHGAEIYEFSTFRREPSKEERQGRKTDSGAIIWRDNQFGTQKQDAWRRDFTVNALYFDPIAKDGIIDFVAGYKDLQSRIVRTIGEPNIRLEEDPVRMLRALKLVGQYDFTLEPKLAEAITANKQKIHLASSVRLFEELLKILNSPYSCQILQAIEQHGLLAELLPNLSECWKNEHGVLLRKVLRIRDEAMINEECSKSKSLALATLCIANIINNYAIDVDSQQLWESSITWSKECRTIINSICKPLPVSRFLSSRARDIILMQARFLNCKGKSKFMKHPEYKYGRLLFTILHKLFNWEPEILAYWPKLTSEQEVMIAHKSSRKKRGYKPRRHRKR